MKLIQSVKRRMGTEEKKSDNSNTTPADSTGSTTLANSPNGDERAVVAGGGGANSSSQGTSSRGPPVKQHSGSSSGGHKVNQHHHHQHAQGFLNSTQMLIKPGHYMSADVNPFEDLPPLRNAPVAERSELFRKKVRACGVVFDFGNQQTYLKEKEAKRQTLLELVEYVNNTRNCFNESIMQDVVNMVSANIFRALPPVHGRNPNSIYDPEDDEPTLEPSWPHLQIVYEFFLRFVVSNDVDPKVAKRFVDQTFVLRLMDLFDSEDPRERDYLKTILHRIYGKFMALRAFIRKAMQNLFYKIIYESEYHNGIEELLEIFGSIVNGFALPLKEEHKQFLEKSLIPLHKVKTLNSFHQQLSYCMTQYVEKDPRLADSIILGLLRFWPITNTPKEVLFLNEVEVVLELTQPPEFQKVEVPLFRRIGQCIASPHFQVAERVLFLWNNDYIAKRINQNRQVIFPIVIGPLYRNSDSHWNTTVHGLSYNVIKLLMEADPPFFDECNSKVRIIAEQSQKAKEIAEAKWAYLQAEYDGHNTAQGSSTKANV
ncbi:Serine/threonine protein phosphatase 2A 59 kDa regulatory subunit B' eta isoform, putative [Perkinsus marinus ATCC 50983]|uniref:Serine/threonine protein phosphatase 2A regulatory subunit n=1 Tax=Perkinsus marinus (strain ATCC 50983 / TXsc) TaxID=423536 RepID=C5LJK1_PERM5|nr:Serine/threonine protein phosphatase 2A 59 kDa regulatory subunit B' eta isoform, putative [Perkinsus marinus ATCC 50983]EER03130.1 Serine/threonine protein phosphatase 2A 59 kDa regulatory subunit B' eta isoform, putative [Perkinsus marinus ATCC 50983]|eukprot:XP_002771314.1 Serine/threonine protein phosphatase 2A 59 kDa regulatory subunit B' eta isoform, putative [Perkinsus marinus ATCC 50983]